MDRKTRAIVHSRTVYIADLEWWWTPKRTHDNAYHVKVHDSMDAQVKKVLEKHEGVERDTRFCCQWEGLSLVGCNAYKVEAAALKIARHLLRFKGVRPLTAF